MKKKIKIINTSFIKNLLIVILLIFVVFLIFFNLKKNSKFKLNKKNDKNYNGSVVYYKVKGIEDGDTIVLENGDTIRYLGIDTPEIHHPTIGKECGGDEATKENEKILKNKRVRLIKDITDRDHYDRLLRYVFTEDGIFVNYHLVRYGFAQTLEMPPDILFKETLSDAQKIAVRDKLGIWKNCFIRKGGEKINE